MSWVALRGALDKDFAPNGLGRRGEAILFDAPMVRGSLLVDWRPDPGEAAQPILTYRAQAPWDAGLCLSRESDGPLRLRTWQGADVAEAHLPVGTIRPMEDMAILYTWDAPERAGRLRLLDRGGRLRAETAVAAPVPLSWRDAARIGRDTDLCTLGPGVGLAALADHVTPIGPWPGLAAETPVMTTRGRRPVSTLRTGDMVVTHGGQEAQVRWCASIGLPARGALAPVLLRAPFRGLTQDIVVAPWQDVALSGSQVEYLFGADRVRCAAGDLLDKTRRLPADGLALHRFWNVLLDQPGMLLDVAGLPVLPLALGPAGDLRHSVLGQMPPELSPADRGGASLRPLDIHEVRGVLARRG
ncbi:Hint domain-containing protein [Roseisalinus antarcticus]|uniref:Hedgehog/Intein (Hint) domain-containing protein n=1 Tax=Roseisalinus antarcticus TaxID=254357 RepID=A0A1Y5TBI7_9RHOB|nr:Hint domain-containing protein [Roseisalinus antarcticus]SLN58265.1 hypothetical protein ROA7023_02668 [Roseisalinus antarcticus]